MDNKSKTESLKNTFLNSGTDDVIPEYIPNNVGSRMDEPHK